MERMPDHDALSQAGREARRLRRRAVGRALLYFLIYIGVQSLVSGIYGVAIAVRAAVEAGVDADSSVILQKAMEGLTGGITVLTGITNLAVLAVYLTVFLAEKKNPLHEVWLRPVAVRKLLCLVPLGIALNILVSSLLSFLPESLLADYGSASGAVLSGTGLVSFLVIAVLSPLTEEVVFRGILYEKLSLGLSRVLSILVSSLIFGLLHGNPVWMTYAFLFGVVLCLLTDQYRTLLAPVITHMSFNAAGYLAWLWGDAPVLPLMGGALLIVAAMWMAVRKETEQP